MNTEPSRVSRLLRAWRGGEGAALEELMPLVHAELRHLAGARLRRERPDHSFDPTDLVHEVYLRLVGKDHPQWQDRAHFYAVAAQLMRQILVDHARGLQAAKRGRGMPKIPLDEALDAVAEKAADVVALDEALQALGQLDPRKSRIVELRYFGGLTGEETARVLDISLATMNKESRLAKAWLYAYLRGEALTT